MSAVREACSAFLAARRLAREHIMDGAKVFGVRAVVTPEMVEAFRALAADAAQRARDVRAELDAAKAAHEERGTRETGLDLDSARTRLGLALRAQARAVERYDAIKSRQTTPGEANVLLTWLEEGLRVVRDLEAAHSAWDDALAAAGVQCARRLWSDIEPWAGTPARLHADHGDDLLAVIAS